MTPVTAIWALLLVAAVAAGPAGERAGPGFHDSLLQVALVEPPYKASIFATQVSKRIVVRVTRKAEVVGDVPITMTLCDAAGQPVAEKVVRQVGESARFDASGLKPGSYVIEAKAPLFGQSLKQTVAVQVLPPAEHEVTFDMDGICHVNGRPFFPLGLYHIDGMVDLINEDQVRAGKPAVTRQRMFQAAVAKGYNLIVAWDVNDMSYLDLAQQHDMKVVQGCDLAGEGFKKWVKRIRSHPALLAAAVVDEPATEHLFNEAQDRFRMMQELDVYHPVQITECYSDLYAAAASTCDLLSIDSYPLRMNHWWRSMPWWDSKWQSSLRLVSRYCEQGRNVVGPHRPWWWVVQSFGYGGWHVPTGQQVRHQAFQAIVAGARGLLFYAYASGEKDEQGRRWWIENHPELWEACGELNAELRALTPVLLAPGGEPSLRCDGAPDIRYLKREHDGRLFVIVVNIGETEQSLDVPMPSRWRRARVQGQDRAIPLTSGRLAETLEPFGIRVYRAEP